MLKKLVNWPIYLLVCFTIFIFAPCEIYFSNIDDMWFGLKDFLPYLLGGFVLIFLALAVVDIIGSKFFSTVWDNILYVAFVILVALYIQGNFLQNSYGELDGQAIDWSLYKSQGVVSVSVFIAVIVAGVVLKVIIHKKKNRKIVKGICWCMLMLQIYTLIMACVINNGLKDKSGYIVTAENETEYSNVDNVIVLILDAFDSRVMNDLCESEFRDQIDSTFKGFEFYKNTTGVYSLTDFAIPQIITGEMYYNQSTYGEYLNSAYEKSPLLNELKDREYEINIYTNISIPQGQAAGSVANWKYERLGVSSHRKLLEYMYKLVGFRYLPQPLKQYCWFYSDDMDELKDSGDIVPYEWANDHFNNNIDMIRADKNMPVSHIVHMKGLHVLRNLDEWFEPKEDVSLEESARGSIRMLERYFSKLDELGIYDDSIIVVMADHGAIEYGTNSQKQCPLLMVKGKGNIGKFRINDDKVSYANLQTMYHQLLSGENVDIADNDKARYIYMTQWLGRALSKDDTNADFKEYEIQGHAYETEKIVETGRSLGE